MKNKLSEYVLKRSTLKGAFMLFGMLLFLSSQTSALTQGTCGVDLTWDSVYGDGYQESSQVTVSVKDKDGVVKATANTATSEQGVFDVEAYDFTSTNGQPVNIVSGDEVTVVVGTGSSTETDMVNTNLTAYTSATSDKIYVKSLPNKSMYLQIGYGGTTNTTSIQTDANGNYTYDSSSDILPNDYFTVYYMDENGNTVTTNPIAPYGMVSTTDDKVWGFFYPPETTATVDVYSDGIKVGSASGKTDSEGDFSVNDCTPQKDIKNGYKIAINCSSEQNEFFANLTSNVDFNGGTVSGKTAPGSHIIVHVDPAPGGNAVDTEADAQTNGNYSVAANPGLEDDIRVAAIHSDGNITQLQIIYGTQNTTIGSPVICAGDKGKDAGNIMIKEARPKSLKNTSNSNSLTLEIKTEGVRFTSLPQAIPTGVNLLHYQAAVSDESRTATWNISGTTTSTAGSVLLSQIKYDVDSDTVDGPVQLELGGKCGVTEETLSNAKVEPFKTTAEIKGTVLDDNSGSGIKGAKITLFKNNETMAEIKTSSSGGFSFPVVQKDNYSLSVTKIGYTGEREEIDLSNGDFSKDFRLLKTNIGVLTATASGVPSFESIENRINDMGYNVCAICEEDLASVAELKAGLDTIFINSSALMLSGTQKQAIKDFVNAGGSLYLSGLSAGLLSDSFPGMVEFFGDGTNIIGAAQTIDVSIKEPGLAGYINPGDTTGTIELEFKGQTAPWRPITSINPTVEVYVSGDVEYNGAVHTDIPLLVGFDSGDGRVLYTSFYNGINQDTQDTTSEASLKIIDYITSSSLMSGKAGNIKAKLKQDGYKNITIFNGIAGSDETTKSIFFSYDVSAGKKLAASLGWLSGNYEFELKEPDGQVTVASSDNSLPFTLISKVAKPQSGRWSFTVKPKSLTSGVNLYVAVIGTGDVDQNSGGNSGGGSSSGGSSGGNGSGTQKGTSDGAVSKAPTGLKATPAKDNIKLTWTAITGENIAGYNVYRAMKGDKEITKLNKEMLVSAEYVDTTPQTGKLYYYMVSSVDKAGNESKLSLFVAASPVDVLAEITFSDVPKGAWYKEYLSKLFFADIIDGYTDGTFKPQANITRAEFCKMLLNAVGMNVGTSTAESFDDTKQHWGSSYIATAHELGIVDGYGDGTFRPDNNITRSEISKMVVKTKEYPATDKPSGFLDCSDCWADQYISILKERQIVAGYPDNLYKPQNFTTRAEACKITWLMLEK